MEKIKQDRSENISKLKEKLEKYLRRMILVGSMSIATSEFLSSCNEQKVEEIKTPKIEAVDYSVYKTFNEAFAKARNDDQKTFLWNGKEFTTELVDQKISDLYHESKEFLRQYYSSEYFKNKLLTDRDSSNIASEISDEAIEKMLSGNYTPSDEARFKNPEKTKDFVVAAETREDSLAKIYLDNLEEPTYFSITSQKAGGKDSADGHYIRKTKGVFISQKDPQETKEITTAVHELAHKASGANNEINTYSWIGIEKRAREAIIKNIDKLVPKYGDVKGVVDYFSNPTEIDARQNSTRFWLYKNLPDYKPDTQFTIEHFNFLTKNYDKLPYDVQQLMDIFSEKEIFIDNMNRY